MKAAVVDAVDDEHLGCRRHRCDLAKVVGRRFARGRPEQQKTAAAKIPGCRVGHGQSERRGHRGINGIPTVTKYVETHAGGMRLL